MFKHIIKIFFRDLFKNKTFNLINLFGLSIALASAFLILLFIIHEINFDKFHEQKDSIYRINATFKWGVDQEAKVISGSILMKPYLLNDFPEISSVVRIFNGVSWGDGQVIKVQDNWIPEDDFMFVDDEFFDVFSYEIVYGNKTAPLLDKYSVVISEKAAQKYFGRNNPVGETITVKNIETTVEYTVTAVLKDIPSNSTFQAQFIANFDLVEHIYANRGWNLSNFQQYVVLKENTSEKELEEKMNSFFKKVHPDKDYAYALQNLSDLYFESDDLVWYTLARGEEKKVILFSVISLLIILIASINYMILSTAKGVGRNMEIGIRKVIGASRTKIIRQVLIETFLFISLVFPFALMVSELLLPLVNYLLMRNMEIRYFENLPYLFGLIGVLMIVGLFSASYIALYLSKFKPEDIIKKRFTTKYGKSYFRKTLISLQLVVFVSLFIFSGVIILQIKFAQKTDVGYSTKDIIAFVPPHRHDVKQYDNFVESIKSNPDIESVTQVASSLFTSTKAAENISNIKFPEKEIASRYFTTDVNFIEAFEFELIDGRAFNPDLTSDKNKFIINETAAKELNIKSSKGEFINIGENTYELIGIVKDFHIGSLHDKIPPVLIGIRPDWMIVTQVIVKSETNNYDKLIKFCRDKWEENGTGGTLDYYFMENKIQKLYDDDLKFGNTIIFFTILTVIIAFLGLFGISLFISKQRNKEAGIHKAFGATFNNIFMLISKEFIVLIVLANLVSWPIAYKLSTNWLQNYSYQIDFPAIIPILVLVISLIFIVTVVGINAVRVARQNPTDILRYE